MKLQQILAIARECKGLSLRELEKKTGISNALLYQMETGQIKEPSFRNIVKVSKVLGVGIERLAESVLQDWLKEKS